MQASHRFSAGSALFDDDNIVSYSGLIPVMTLVLQTGLSDLLAEKITITTSKIKSGAANPAPKLSTLIAGIRLRSGKTGSGKGAGHMIAGATATARSAGAAAQILVRGDSAYGTRKVVRACLRGGAEFSLVTTKNTAIMKTSH